MALEAVVSIGKKLIDFIEKSTTENFVDNQVLIKKEIWEAAVKVIPNEWVGFELSYCLPQSTKPLQYSIDTDLYDISSSQEAREFGMKVEDKIIEVLDALLQEKAKIRNPKPGRVVLEIPLRTSKLSLSKGMLFTRTEESPVL